jgi:hypothetical protein
VLLATAFAAVAAYFATRKGLSVFVSNMRFRISTASSEAGRLYVEIG